MTRGKYAVRAAREQASRAADTVDTLRARLAEAQHQHETQLAELRERNERLAAQIARGVEDLAKEENLRVAQECRESLEAAEKAWRERALNATRCLAEALQGSEWTALDATVVVAVGEILGVTVGQLLAAEGEDMGRSMRRSSNDRLRDGAPKLPAAVNIAFR